MWQNMVQALDQRRNLGDFFSDKIMWQVPARYQGRNDRAEINLKQRCLRAEGFGVVPPFRGEAVKNIKGNRIGHAPKEKVDGRGFHKKTTTEKPPYWQEEKNRVGQTKEDVVIAKTHVIQPLLPMETFCKKRVSPKEQA